MSASGATPPVEVQTDGFPIDWYRTFSKKGAGGVRSCKVAVEAGARRGLGAVEGPS